MRNTKFLLWVIFFVLGYGLLIYSLNDRWGTLPSLTTITLFYLAFKPWKISPLDGDFTRERTRIQDLVDWFKNVGKTGKYKDFE